MLACYIFSSEYLVAISSRHSTESVSFNPDPQETRVSGKGPQGSSLDIYRRVCLHGVTTSVNSTIFYPLEARINFTLTIKFNNGIKPNEHEEEQLANECPWQLFLKVVSLRVFLEILA